MQWDVSLNEPFSYSKIGLVLFIIIIIIGVSYFLYKTLKEMKIKEKIEASKRIDVNAIKNQYINKLNDLINEVNSNSITERKAYNKLSLIIREFVYKVSGLDVLKYTLIDFKKLNNNSLIELVNEYYVPEFSKEGSGDIKSSIEKTRKVIQEWQ